ncbi:uncharacterized protein LOC135813325 [Sycon ciliatum]|uniref:uncharacterized protein LOC135813325 n=1 Tax=Sycon ciliatum TaxID=27933 RepID=UPI0031F60BD2
MGRKTEHYGDMFAPILLQKLPKAVRLDVCKGVGDASFSLQEVLRQLREEIRTRERCSYVSSVQSGTREPSRGAMATAASLNTTVHNMACIYCGRDHATASCSVVTSVAKRKDSLIQQRRCFVCTRKGHIAAKCMSKTRCGKCDRRHHTTICADGQQTFSGTCSAMSQASAPLLQTAKAAVASQEDPNRQLKARILLDLGSQRSYVTNSLRQQLDLPTDHTEQLAIRGFGTQHGSPKEVDVVRLSIATLEGSPVSVAAVAVPLISAPISRQFPTEVAESLAPFSTLQLADDCTGAANVDILIGADHYWEFTEGNVIRGSDTLVAIATKLGWVLSGCPKPSAPASAATHVFAVTAEQLEQQLKRFWDLESLGIQPLDGNPVQAAFDETIKFADGRYTVSLPWKEVHAVLPDNFGLSHKRLLSLTNKIEKVPDVFSEYARVMAEQLATGVIEEVPANEVGEVGEVHYIPHQAVVRKDKATTKVRVVYDASAHAGKNPSINSCLHSGPNLLEHIPDILLRFRCYPVALTGDIEKAFLMLNVCEHDRNALRFLWWDRPFSSERQVQVYRFARVMFGLTSSPFLLNATLKHHLEQYRQEDPEFVDEISRSMYVDDLAAGAADDEEAVELYTKLKVRMADGGFNIRKFASSSTAVQEHINRTEGDTAAVHPSSGTACEDDSTYAKASLNVQPHDCDKVLGVTWDRQTDSITVDIASVFDSAKERPTKRTVSSQAARLFDPLGIVSPVTVKLKIFLQQLHVAGLDWDSPLSIEQEREWASLMSALQRAAPVRMPRCYFSGATADAKVSLHGFCDASQAAFASVVYLRIEAATVSIQFAMAKTRVAPTAKQTIPRLELLAALTLARLLVTVRQALDKQITVASTHCWTDSRVALGWITNTEQEWKQFVHNRVCEIRRLTDVSVWDFCPGTLNPADIPSRGATPDELHTSVWLTGPAWLRESERPPGTSFTEGEQVPEECRQELKKSAQVTSLVTTDATSSSISAIMDCTQYSSYQKLRRVTAYVLKFVKLVQGRRDEAAAETVLLDEAQRLWIADVQQSAPDATNRIAKAKKQLVIFADESGLLRCGGRLQAADLSAGQKHPVLLIPGHHVTELIVADCHERVLHNGVPETLTELRAQFWICRGRQYVRMLLHRCRLCKMLEGKPYAGPPPPPLSEFRTQVGYAFQHTGVDFAGPFHVRTAQDVEKAYLVLYTCAVTRAVHLDLVSDLSTTTFLRSFRRFVARRGVPAVVKSDNGKTFKAAARLLRDLHVEPETKSYLQAKNIRWTFNLEKAPWWGGFFERLIKSVKRCVKKVLRSAQITADELLTLLADVEAILNSRPLTHVSTEDVREPLTPSHLLCGRRVLSLPDMVADDPDEVPVSRRYAYLQELLRHFWSRWKNEYLLELRNSHRIGRHTDVDTIAVGDIVVIHQDGVQRGLWKLGVVDSLRPSEDGRVRGAVVRTTTKSGRPTTLNRPIQRLYPVEQLVVSPTAATPEKSTQQMPDAADDTPVEDAADASPVPDTRQTRPRRAAAQRAQQERQQLISANRL